jgi:hypothetical protein
MFTDPNDPPIEMKSQEQKDISDNTPVIVPTDQDQAVQPPSGHRTDRMLWYTIGGIVISACIVMILLLFATYRLVESQIEQAFRFPHLATYTPHPVSPSMLTATQRASEFSLSTVEARATASAVSADWQVVKSDAFTDNQNGWAIGLDDDELSTITREISNGKYIWQASAKSGFVDWIDVPGGFRAQNFTVTVEGKSIGKSPAEYGLLFHAEENGNHYLFEINDDGWYQLALMYGNEWITIIDWTKSAAIKKGESNRITVVGQGPQFLFFINDNYVAQAYDERIKAGTVAIAASLDGNTQGSFEFDNFEYHSASFMPPPAPAALTATLQAIPTLVSETTQWKVTYSDDFSKTTKFWVTGRDYYPGPELARFIRGGKYLWEATTSTSNSMVWVNADKTVTDFSVSVEGQQTSNSATDRFGLIFRKDYRSNYYYFGIDRSAFKVALNYGGTWFNLIEETPSSAIHSEGPNRIAVIGKGPYFVFLINDQVVANLYNDEIPRGITGLAIELFTPDQKSTFEFDNFELREP